VLVMASSIYYLAWSAITYFVKFIMIRLYDASTKKFYDSLLTIRVLSAGVRIPVHSVLQLRVWGSSPQTSAALGPPSYYPSTRGNMCELHNRDCDDSKAILVPYSSELEPP
jgi:hypothetical protein